MLLNIRVGDANSPPEPLKSSLYHLHARFDSDITVKGVNAKTGDYLITCTQTIEDLTSTAHLLIHNGRGYDPLANLIGLGLDEASVSILDTIKSNHGIVVLDMVGDFIRVGAYPSISTPDLYFLMSEG